MTQYQCLDDFVAEVLDGWMLHDLDNLTKIAVLPGASGNCNFPIALYVFSCIEFLGQLTNKDPMPKTNYTKTAILGFFDDFFPEVDKNNIKSYEDSFVNIFRNGLAHNYFAKNAGISRKASELLRVDENGKLILDADTLVEAFRKAIENLKQSITSSEELCNRIIDRYNALYQGNLKYNFTTTTTTTTSSLSSGASLAHPEMVKNLRYTTTLPYDPENDG